MGIAYEEIVKKIWGSLPPQLPHKSSVLWKRCFVVDMNSEPISPQDSSAADTSPPSPVTSETSEKRSVGVEEFKITGDALVSKIKELINQGNIRRIIIKNEEGRVLIEIPLTVGVIGGAIGAAIFPVVAAVGVIGAMVAHLTVVIERQEGEAAPKDQPNDQ